MYMPEISGQLWEFSFDIQSRPVPVDQGAGGKAVAHIMKPRATAMTLCDRAEAELLGKLRKGVACHAIRDSDAALGDEESSSGFSQNAVSPGGVLF